MYLLHKVAEKLSAEILFAEIMTLTFKAVNGTGLAWPLAWSLILFLEMGVVNHGDRARLVNNFSWHELNKLTLLSPRHDVSSKILRSLLHLGLHPAADGTKIPDPKQGSINFKSNIVFDDGSLSSTIGHNSLPIPNHSLIASLDNYRFRLTAIESFFLFGQILLLLQPKSWEIFIFKCKLK